MVVSRYRAASRSTRKRATTVPDRPAPASLATARGAEVCATVTDSRRTVMKATSIIWRRTFPDSAPGTDGVAIFEGRIMGRVRLLAEGSRDPKPWSWSITDPELAGRPGWANTHGEMA